VGDERKLLKRMVSEQEVRDLATKEGLIFLGETSCFDDFNNCG
jgi:hypothetical protein